MALGMMSLFISNQPKLVKAHGKNRKETEPEPFPDWEGRLIPGFTGR
jgi:hypothetical protein